MSLGHIGLDGENGKAHLFSQEADEAVLEREKLARAVRRLAQADDARVADNLSEGRQVGVICGWVQPFLKGWRAL